LVVQIHIMDLQPFEAAGACSHVRKRDGRRSGDDDLERLGAVPDAASHPSIDVSTAKLIVRPMTSRYPELVQGCVVDAEQEQVGGEVLELAPILRRSVAVPPSGGQEVVLGVVDVYAGGRAPEVPPPP
jgi:hypothetical protein